MREDTYNFEKYMKFHEHLYVPRDEELVSLTAEEAIFAHRREPVVSPPRIKSLLWGIFIGGFSLFALVAELFGIFPFEKSAFHKFWRIVCWLVGTGWGTTNIAIFMSRSSKYPRAIKLCPPGFFVTWFDKRSGTCSLIGPVANGTSLQLARGPVLARVPLKRVKLVELHYEDYDAMCLVLLVEKPPHPDLGLEFSLLAS